MKIAIDLSALKTKQKAGIEYYTHELVKALIREDDENEFILIGRDNKLLEGYKRSSKHRVLTKNIPGPHTLWMLWASLQLRILNVDYLISTSNFIMNLLVPRTIQIVYDVTPVTHPTFWPKKSVKSFKSQLNIASQNAEKFVTISQSTKSEFLKLYPDNKDKTFYIGSGLHEWALKKSTDSENKKVLAKYKISKPYILSISTIQPRKNHVNMIRAFAEFKKSNPDYTYLIVGKDGWMYEEVYQLVDELNLRESVLFAKYAPEEDLAPLYDNAAALMFCSYAEGFGLPLLEARARKIPVVASEIPVHKEVVDGYADFCNPNDPSSIASALSSAIKKEYTDNNRSKVLKEFSWEGVAKRLIEVYSV